MTKTDVVAVFFLLLVLTLPVSATDVWSREKIDPWTESPDSPVSVSQLEVYNNKLYAVSGDANGSRIYSYDGRAWNISYKSPNISERPSVSFLKAYNNKLYAGITTIYLVNSTPRLNTTFYVYDGNSWAVSNAIYDATKRVTAHAQSFAVHNNKLYVGTMGDIDLNGEIYAYDGTSWTVSYDPPGYTATLTVYNGKLYAAQDVVDFVYKVPTAVIYAYDGTSWAEIHSIPRQNIRSMVVYNSKLYVSANMYGSIYVYDGDSWTKSHATQVPSDFTGPFAIYNNKLYAGTRQEGRFYVYDGTSWITTYAASKTMGQIYSFAVYNSKLYAATSDGLYELYVTPINQTTAPALTAIPSSTQIPPLTVASTSKQCDNGCAVADSCVAFGTRLAVNGTATYCDFAKKVWESQKTDGAQCQNNYECTGNYCADGTCGNIQKELQETKSLLQKVLDFFRMFLGRIRA